MFLSQTKQVTNIVKYEHIDSVSHLLYSQTEKIVNDRNFSGMFIVSWRKIIEKIRTCDLAT